ncbi:hypothetical protein ACFWP3_31145 [Streptomyces sp. NPDC058525]|uniref:hypothetical protein n=1 Tax=Streptomyces sp. NPDC058525 TaxID=3346538 RepID=UPI00364DB92C
MSPDTPRAVGGLVYFTLTASALLFGAAVGGTGLLALVLALRDTRGPDPKGRGRRIRTFDGVM